MGAILRQLCDYCEIRLARIDTLRKQVESQETIELEDVTDDQLCARVAQRCAEILKLDNSGQLTDPYQRVLLAQAKVRIQSLIRSNSMLGLTSVRLQDVAKTLSQLSLATYPLDELEISDALAYGECLFAELEEACRYNSVKKIFECLQRLQEVETKYPGALPTNERLTVESLLKRTFHC